MPTYEYKREDGTTFEVVQGINDEPLEKCPDTGQKVKRVITGGGGVVYKGDGFYITDYKRKEEKNKNGSSSQSTSVPTGSSSNGNESASASKPEKSKSGSE